MKTVMSKEAVAVPSPVSAYAFFLCRLAVPVLLCHCVTILASSSSVYETILTSLSHLHSWLRRWNYSDEAVEVLKPRSKNTPNYLSFVSY